MFDDESAYELNSNEESSDSRECDNIENLPVVSMVILLPLNALIIK